MAKNAPTGKTPAKKAPAKKPPAKKTPQPEATEFQVDLDEDLWASEEAGTPGLISRLSAELIGTFVFVFVGLGTALFGAILTTTAILEQSSTYPVETAEYLSSFPNQNLAAALTGALAWGITLLALFVAFGRVSGAHFNPAVTIGAWVAGRFPGRDVALYIIVQVSGAVTAAGVIFWLSKGFPLLTAGDPITAGIGLDAPTAGQAMSTVAIGDGEYSPAGVPLNHGLVIEFIVVALLVGIYLAATSIRAPRGQAAVSIGLSFSVLVLLAAPLTGGGLNPARVTATALFAENADGDRWGLGQLWYWWLAMILAGAFVGLLVRAFGPEEDLEFVEVYELAE